jgi:cysteine desulfurase
MRLPSNYRYFDHAAGSPVREEALTAFVTAARAYGNPGSVHRAGQRALASLDASRAELAKALACDMKEIVFTSTATEANNLVVLGTVKAYKRLHAGAKPRVIISALEHDSIRVPAERLSEAGVIELVVIPVDAEKGLDVKELESLLTDNTALVSIMHVSNETGTMLPIAKIARMLDSHRDDNVWPRFHADAAQALAYVPDLATAYADLVTYSGYKVGGVAGSACLVVTDRSLLDATVVGGGQEKGLRSGTEDVAAAASFAKAAMLARDACAVEAKRLEKLKALFLKELAERAPHVVENVSELESTPHIVNLWIPGTHAQQTLTRLDMAGFAIGAGSACSARSLEPSRALLALGYGKTRAEESVRVSFGLDSEELGVTALAREFK